MLGNDYITKLPSSLYNMIKDEKLDSYSPTYDGIIALEQQGIKRESIAMLALFHLNYWCESNEEKAEFRKMLKTNETKYQEDLREKYNPDNLFKNRTASTIQENEVINENVAMVEYKESVFKKFINRIKSFFRRNNS